MAEVPPPKRDATASEEPETNKKQKTEGGTGLKRADGTPWEPITGTLVPIVGGKEGLKQVRDAASLYEPSSRLREAVFVIARGPHGASTPSS